MIQFLKSKWVLFITALLQVMFVAMNVIFISNHMIVEMLITGFLISLIWTVNVKKVVFGGWTDRIVYSVGAMVGTGVGYLLSNFVMNNV